MLINQVTIESISPTFFIPGIQRDLLYNGFQLCYVTYIIFIMIILIKGAICNFSSKMNLLLLCSSVLLCIVLLCSSTNALVKIGCNQKHHQ